MKTSVKYYHLTVDAQGRWSGPRWPKSPPLMTYDVSHKKSAPPNQKIFFRVQSTRLADPFGLLNSSLAQSAEELGRW